MRAFLIEPGNVLLILFKACAKSDSFLDVYGHRLHSAYTTWPIKVGLLFKTSRF